MSLRTSLYSKTLRRAAIASVLGLSLSVTSCGLLATGSAAPSAPSINLNGSVVAAGKTVDTPTGSYQNITVSKEAAVYKYDPSKFNLEMMASQGYPEDSGKYALEFATTFMAEQYLDSIALEGDMGAFQTWYDTTGSKLLDQRIATGASDIAPHFLILGNYGKQKNFPEFIHDGGPRVSSASLNLVEAGPYFVEDGSKIPGISYGLDFAADYRVSDAGAAAFGAAKTGLSSEDFIKSNMAKPLLKDGTGENKFHVTGRVNIVVNQDGAGNWVVVGFENVDIKGDSSDFTETNFEANWV
jgi:hypothetical protein